MESFKFSSIHSSSYRHNTMTDPNTTTARTSITRDSNNSESSSSSATSSSPEHDLLLSSSSSPGLLQVFIHNARNIHNICIYDDQDVYAKFSFTNYNQTVSTQIVRGGGKNPDFNHKLVLKLNQLDSVLKCEVWMFSRLKQLMDDQLLGFALVPVSMVARTGTLTDVFSLSSTDLFHSPAGTVRLTLSLHPTDASASATTSSSSLAHFNNSSVNSISSEVVLLDNHPSSRPTQVEYSRIEFPDIKIVRENQQMVSEYFKLAAAGERSSVVLRPEVMGEPCSFLHLGGADSYHDSLMNQKIDSPHHHHHHHHQETNPGLSEIENRKFFTNDNSNAFITNLLDRPASAHTSIKTPTSKKMKKKKNSNSNDVLAADNLGDDGSELITNFNNPMATAVGKMINMEADQVVIQRQIVDMYMKSMQQFTESLAKMKLPMDHLSSTHPPAAGHLIHQLWDINNDNNATTIAAVVGDSSTNNNNSNELEQDKSKSEVDNNNISIIKRDGSNSRVFYGSRAFF